MKNAGPEDREFLKELSRRVRLNRRYQGLTQAELGDRAGLSRSFVAVFETGRHGIDITTLRRVAEALDLSLPALVDVPAADELEAP